MSYAIDMSNIVVEYPMKDGAGVIRVLNNVDLKIRKGEFVSLVGPTGCGKSTLINLILGFERPTSGTVRVDEAPVEYVDRDRGIVYQKYSLFPHLTVEDNIAFGIQLERTILPERLLLQACRATGLGRLATRFLRAGRIEKAARETAIEYLAHVGLDPRDAKKHPYELSGGMRQRVAIAQALVMRPKILLMDEAFGALDERTRERMQVFLLNRWQEDGTTIVFISHHLEEALFLGTRFIALSQYYYEADGSDGVGSKIVEDLEVPGGHPKPFSFKSSPWCVSTVERIRDRVLDVRHRRTRDEFNLAHRDAWPPKGAREEAVHVG